MKGYYGHFRSDIVVLVSVPLQSFSSRICNSGAVFSTVFTAQTCLFYLAAGGYK